MLTKEKILLRKGILKQGIEEILNENGASFVEKAKVLDCIDEIFNSLIFHKEEETIFNLDEVLALRKEGFRVSKTEFGEAHRYCSQWDEIICKGVNSTGTAQIYCLDIWSNEQDDIFCDGMEFDSLQKLFEYRNLSLGDLGAQ